MVVPGTDLTITALLFTVGIALIMVTPIAGTALGMIPIGPTMGIQAHSVITTEVPGTMVGVALTITGINPITDGILITARMAIITITVTQVLLLLLIMVKMLEEALPMAEGLRAVVM